jgi:hypothetical protein
MAFERSTTPDVSHALLISVGIGLREELVATKPAPPTEHVVEVMGNAAAQLPDGFHLLGLAQLVFRCFAASLLLDKPLICV